jgi:hypothetical protein
MNHSRRLILRLSPEMLERLTRGAADERVTIARYVRILLARALGLPENDQRAARGPGSSTE